MANIQKWGSYEVDAAEAEQQELDKLGSSTFMKLKVGRNVIRILPPKVGQRSPFVMTFQHVINRPGQDKPLSFNCPRMMAKEPCPVCQRAEKMKSSGRDADYKAASALFPRLRVYCNVIDRSNPEAGPKVLAIGKTIHSDLVALRNDQDAGGDFTHPENGFDIIIKRTGTTKNDTGYDVKPARNESPLGNLEWIEMQENLARYAVVPSIDDIRKLLAGDDDDDDDDEEAAALPPARARAPRAARRRIDDVIDTDGEDVED